MNKGKVGEKRSTVCTDCLLKNTSTKPNKYVVYQKLNHSIIQVTLLTFTNFDPWVAANKEATEPGIPSD